MSDQSQHLERLQDIRQMMQKSSRFISLSGLSGIAAGFCALVAAWIAAGKIRAYRDSHVLNYSQGHTYNFRSGYGPLEQDLILIAGITFVVAFCLAFFFTYLRSTRTGVPIWGLMARRVMIQVTVPMIMGGLLILRVIDLGAYMLIAPSCLIFYGLGLINASKYTFPEIRYLGYGQLLLGAINLWVMGYGLVFWAIGFGLLHIVYGFLMWWKHERGGSPIN